MVWRWETMLSIGRKLSITKSGRKVTYRAHRYWRPRAGVPIIICFTRCFAERFLQQNFKWLWKLCLASANFTWGTMQHCVPWLVWLTHTDIKDFPCIDLIFLVAIHISLVYIAMVQMNWMRGPVTVMTGNGLYTDLIFIRRIAGIQYNQKMNNHY